MNEKIDNRLNLLLKKISNLDSELEDILCNKNDINSMKFIKINDSLYRNIDFKKDIHLGWNGINTQEDKNIVFYIKNNPVSILLFLERKTLKLMEVEFIDWLGNTCYKENTDCLDIALNTDILIEDGSRQV